MEVKIKMLTPLWTGGVDGTMDRIHETGIIGSLRWWYEAIVRGLGGNACDPTSHACELTGDRLKRYNAARKAGKNWWEALDKASICDACKVFGTTGWKRRFRVVVNTLEGEFDVTEGMFPSGRVHPHKRNLYRTGGWFLHGGYHGTLQLEFIGSKEVLWCEILPVLLFMEQWGALGPKTSLGYGVFKILSINGFQRPADGDWRRFLKDSRNIQNCSGPVGQWWWGNQTSFSSNSNYHGILPALTNMFFSRVRFSPLQSDREEWWKQFDEIKWLKKGEIPENNATWTGRKQQKPNGPYKISNPLPIARIKHWVYCHHIFPVAPILRTRLRYDQQSICYGNGESEWCNFIFGIVSRNERIQSKIRVSWVYQVNQQWELRIWGWIPDNLPGRVTRGTVMANLRQWMGVPPGKTQQRQWHTAQNGQLWQSLNVTDPEVCWFEYHDSEEPPDYLQALLEGCGCKKEENQ